MNNDIEMAKMQTAGRIYFNIGLWGLIFIFIISFTHYSYAVMIFDRLVIFRLLALSFSNGWAFIYTIACITLLIIGSMKKRKVKKYIKENPFSKSKL